MATSILTPTVLTIPDAYAVRTATASENLLSTDEFVIAAPASSNITLALPSPSTNVGAAITVKRNSSSYLVYVSGGPPEAVLYNFLGNDWNAFGGRSSGVVILAQAGDAVGKYKIPLGRGADTPPGGADTVFGKIYQVTSDFYTVNGVDITGKMTLVATSSNSYSFASLPNSSTDPRTSPDLEFQFPATTLVPGQYYYIAAELNTTNSGNFLSRAFQLGLTGGKAINGNLAYGGTAYSVQSTVLTPASTVLIDGSLTYTLSANFQSVTVISDGTRWLIM